MTEVCCTVDSPLGRLWILSSPAGLARIAREPVDLPAGDPFGAVAAFGRYLDGELTALDALPVDPQGTDFQRRVWLGLRQIPPGQTLSYGAFTARLGLTPTTTRAVGTANGANPLPVVLPCHRVIGARGDLVGFGWGLPAKRWLLRHEGLVLPGEQVGLV